MPWSWNLHVREFCPSRDLKKYPVWFLNKSHSYPAFSPLFMWTWCFSETHGVWYGANETWWPTTRGHVMLDLDGCSLETGLRIKDEAEIEERAKRHRKFLTEEFAPKWDETWANITNELEGYYKKLRDFDYEKATPYELYNQFNDALWIVERMWKLHFYLMYGQFGAYWEFEDLCKEYVGINENDPLWHKLIRGYDNYLFVMDRAMWALRNRALELRVDETFRRYPATEVIPALKETAAGKEWVENDLNDFLTVKGYGWRQPRMMEFINPAWWEDPTPVISHLQQYLMLPGGADTIFPVDEIRPRLVEEREAAEQEVLSKAKAHGCPDMDWFTALMKLSQRTSFFSESHDWIFECQCFPSFRYCIMKIGERLVKYDTISCPDDLFFFVPDELQLFIALPENYDVRDLAEERRAMWTARKEYLSRPPFISREPMKPDETTPYILEPKDPVVCKISMGTFPKARPETGAILFGNCGNAGVAEGTVRLLIKEGDVGSVRPGEILVCPATYGSWSPIYPLLKGVVTDGGGSVSHACIVGREYDIPVVANTGTATYTLKTGDKIRIKADEGLVFRIN